MKDRINVTNDLYVHEFECNDGCGLNRPHPILVVALQQLRTLAGTPLIINCPGRCPSHNTDVGGARESLHLPDEAEYTRAVDCHLVGMPLYKQYLFAGRIDAFCEGGIGVYVDDETGLYLHLDVRDAPARWARLNGETAELQKVWDAARCHEQDPSGPHTLCPVKR